MDADLRRRFSNGPFENQGSDPAKSAGSCRRQSSEQRERATNYIPSRFSIKLKRQKYWFGQRLFMAHGNRLSFIERRILFNRRRTQTDADLRRRFSNGPFENQGSDPAKSAGSCRRKSSEQRERAANCIPSRFSIKNFHGQGQQLKLHRDA